jgi:hypothetical protein
LRRARVILPKVPFRNNTAMPSASDILHRLVETEKSETPP